MHLVDPRDTQRGEAAPLDLGASLPVEQQAVVFDGQAVQVRQTGLVEVKATAADDPWRQLVGGRTIPRATMRPPALARSSCGAGAGGSWRSQHPIQPLDRKNE